MTIPDASSSADSGGESLSSPSRTEHPRGSTGQLADNVAASSASNVAVRLDAHCGQLQACRRCANAPGVRPIVARTRAPRAMLVGQAPGQVEAAGGRPFAGRAGATLFRWLARAGLTEDCAREWFYIAAVTRCYPGPHRAGRGDRVPSVGEQRRCAEWLDAELRIIRPPLLVLVGRLAMERFLPRLPLHDLVGREHEVRHAGGVSVAIPLPHPSGASSWIHMPGHQALLTDALSLLRERVDARRVREAVA